MTPEIRKALETNTLPFGEMSRELQEAFIVAACLDGVPHEAWSKDNNLWYRANLNIFEKTIYRLAPEPVIDPEYPWDLFDDEIQWMAIDGSGVLAMAENKMEQSVGNGTAYWFLASCRVKNIKFNRGNVAWQDSQRQRPKK